MKRFLLAVCIPPLLLGFLELLATLLGVVPAPRFWLECTGEDGKPWLQANLRSPWGGLPFRPNAFPTAKDHRTYRIFCLGESTTNGFPFARHSSFSQLLAVRLAQLHPYLKFEVVKMGYDAKSALAIAELCREVVRYDPDLIVLYMGHNEFLGQNLPDVRHPWSSRFRRVLSRFSLGRLLLSLAPAPEGAGHDLPKNPERRIDDHPFLSAAELEQGYENFREGLTAIFDYCREARVALLICRPASNLKDYPPRRSHLSETLGAEERRQFRTLEADAQKLLDEGLYEDALPRLREAEAIDATPALLHFRIGECLRHLGDLEGARGAYLQARDRDDHPNRATSRILRIINDATRFFARMADVEKTFTLAAPDRLPGRDLFLDNCHPTLDAQNLIADAILHAMARANLVAPEDEWLFDAEPDLAEYRRRMGLDLTRVATDFAADAIVNMAQLLGVEGAVDPRRPAEEAFRFALQYDASNPTAELGLAIVATLRDDAGAAAGHLRVSQARDAAVFRRFLEFAKGKGLLQDVARRLSGAPAGGGQ
ncbi:MAG: hypothetical protein AB1486_19000 [Planctomycetota bacterium]